MSLSSFRETWEKGLNVLFVHAVNGTVLVILDNFNGLYRCHRYFQLELSSKWNVSVDKANCSIVEAFSWLQENLD